MQSGNNEIFIALFFLLVYCSSFWKMTRLVLEIIKFAIYKLFDIIKKDLQIKKKFVILVERKKMTTRSGAVW